MRKVSLLAILVLMTATALVAQTTGSTYGASKKILVATYDPNDIYVVGVDGKEDTLWRMGGPEWEKLLPFNPWINQERRLTRYPDGYVFGLIRDNDRIVGVKLVNKPVAGATVIETYPRIQQQAYKTNVDFPIYDVQRDATFPWYSILLVLLVGALMYWTFRYFNRPGQAGRPLVAGGIRTDSPDRIAEDVEYAAVRVAERRSETSTNAVARDTGDQRPLRRVGAIYEATFMGPGRSGYAGQTKMPPRHYNSDRGYQSRFRFADGHEENLNFMQICGNDIIFSNMRYFPAQVILGQIVVPAPDEIRITRQTETPAAVTTTVPAPAAATAATGTTPVVPEPTPPAPAAPATLAEVVNINSRDSNPTTTIVAGDRRVDFTGGAEIRVNGKDVEVEFTDGGKFTLTPAPVKKAKKAKAEKARENVG